MLRRVSSSLFGLIRTPSSTEVPSLIRPSFSDAPRPSQPESKSSDEIEIESPPKAVDEDHHLPAVDAAQVPLPTEEETPIIVDDTEERDAFVQTLEISYHDPDASEALVDLPYTFDKDLVITSDGLLRGYVNMGLLEGEANFHIGLRRQPSVARRITRLELIIQSPSKDGREGSVATQREGLLEWARTVPALTNLTSFKLSHLAAGDNSSSIVYVPSQDPSEKDVSDEEKGPIDASILVKSIAWFFHKKMVDVTLEGVDCSDNATRAWEGARVQRLVINACTARVSSIIPRLPCLKDVQVVELGELSAGCDYLGLLSRVKSNLQNISITTINTQIDLDAFINTFKGDSPLATVSCPFTSPSPGGSLSSDQIERKLQAAFPTTYQLSTPLNEPLDVEMGVLEPSTSHNKGTPSPSRVATLDKKKEELKIAEGAKKEKGRIMSTIRKLRAAASR
ncbi:hypothetical protein FRB94_013556 [Tulasnella sp. JGI-2019a]|nr:hypothetical protein FRB94_013556 [Tulasnella sp. JGI-2019a]